MKKVLYMAVIAGAMASMTPHASAKPLSQAIREQVAVCDWLFPDGVRDPVTHYPWLTCPGPSDN